MTQGFELKYKHRCYLKNRLTVVFYMGSYRFYLHSSSTIKKEKYIKGKINMNLSHTLGLVRNLRRKRSTKLQLATMLCMLRPGQN